MTPPTTHKRLPVDLTEVDGNAFFIIGALRKAARKQGWAPAEIDDMTNRLKAGDYYHLVAVAMEYCE